MTDALLRVAQDEVAAGIWRVPHHLRDGLTEHILRGREVGQFLTAVLSNDLREAVGRADDASIGALRQILQFLYFHAPSRCWGSPDAVKAWRDRGGAARHPQLPDEPSSPTAGRPVGNGDSPACSRRQDQPT